MAGVSRGALPGHARSRALLIAVLPMASLLAVPARPSDRQTRDVRADLGLPGCRAGPVMNGLVPAWRMGAIQFFSPIHGVGLTNGTLLCFRRTRGGSEVHYRTQPVRLGLTSDGGQSWRLEGAIVSDGWMPSTPPDEQLVADSLQRMWTIVDGGRLVATTDGGERWVSVPVPGPVVQLARAGDQLLAVTCPSDPTHGQTTACRPQIWRAPVAGSAWRRSRLGTLIAQSQEQVRLAVASSTDFLLNVETPLGTHAAGAVLAISTDGGDRWSTRPDPTWDRHPCGYSGMLTAQPPRVYWLLCVGGAAAGSSTKGLMRSTDGGEHWRLVSAATSLVSRPAQHALPLSEPGGLAAGSPTRVWLALINGLVQSDNGGRTWNAIRTVTNSWGWPTRFSVLDAHHAWLLAPGAALWATGDGRHWRPLGPFHTH